LELESYHHRVDVADRLRECHEEHRARGLVEREPRELRVSHDTHDPIRVRVLGQIGTEVLIDRIFAALEKAADERFVHDRNVLRPLIVGGREVASANELHAEILQVVRAHAVPR